MTNMDIPDCCDHKEQDTTADNMAGASDEELREVDNIDDEKYDTDVTDQAFKLFDQDSDGVITIEELSGLVSKVGGDMSTAEATALIKAAGKDANMGIDFSVFAKLWETLHGETEVRFQE